MSVKRCQREVDSREFSEWLAYWRLEPWGEERGDLRAGIVAATIANSWLGSGTLPHTPRDFMPIFDGGREAEEDADARTLQLQQRLESLTRAAGGTIS